MTDNSGGLEDQIRKQVQRVGKTISGEFNEASSDEAKKYTVKVYQSVDHLESLCNPILDQEYRDEKEKAMGNDGGNDNRYSREDDEMSKLEKAEVKRRLLIDLLHRKGVL